MDGHHTSKRSISAVVALVLAIVALLLSAIPIINNFAFVLAVLAIIFGFIGLRGTRKKGHTGQTMAIVAMVLAVLAGIIVIASQKFYVDTVDKAGKEVQKSVDKATGKNTSDILGKDVEVTLGSFLVVPDQYTTTTNLPVKVTNKLSTSKSYSIQIEAVDQAGTRIAEDTVYANSLGAKQSQDFKAFEYVQSDKVEALKTAKFKVATVSQY